MIGIHTICQAKSWMDYDAYIAPADGDYFLINDVDDDTDDASGTVKRLAWLYVQQRNANLTSLSTIAYSANMLSFLDAADYAAMRTLLAVLPLAGGTVTGSIYLDDGDTNSPGMRFVDETNEYWHLYKVDGSNLHLYTDHAEDQIFSVTNEGAGVAYLVVDGAISEGGVFLVNKYHPLEDQGVSSDDSPTFDDITLTCADGENCGTELDSMPDYDQQCVGDLITVIAGQDTITFGMVLTIENATGKWIAANANSTGVLPARGIACQTADTDDAIEVMLRGFIRDESWDFTGDINKNMLLDDEAGAMVLADGTIPADTGDIIQIIGYVTMTSAQETFYFNPQPVYSVLN